ncbi:MAG: GspE/PulE family protein [Verrucomicrobia bacterium]|nr:GspE/PulE family protein [Verrucomicrobiota bacterium]
MADFEEQILSLGRAAGCRQLERLGEVVRRATGEGWLKEVLEAGLVEEEAFLRGISGAMGMPWWDGNFGTDEVESLRQPFPAELASRFELLPVGVDGGSLELATWDPFDVTRTSVISRLVDRPVAWRMSTRTRIQEGLRQIYGVGAETLDEIIRKRDPRVEEALLIEETTSLDRVSEEEASVLKFVNHILRGALEQRATDIHLEPMEDRFRIRFRVDGTLTEVSAPANIKAIQASVVSRLKIMARLDIAEKRLPQDGRMNLRLGGKKIDVRVATIPSVEGETVSLRLLGQESFSLAKLGLPASLQRNVDELLAMPNGIILITGPTGSGKSTSLYCFLSAINTVDRRIVTIEDPVENKLPGVVQIAVKPDIDLTFAKGLRSILRGDPDVVMVGEMRDAETAEIAIRAALTGHLVFSTLHTNDAVSGITRLLDMGIEPFLVSSAVRAFLAQRLVRRLCPECRKPLDLGPEERERLGFPPGAGEVIYRAEGCARCRHTGYHGRVALFEIVRVTAALEDLINHGASRSRLLAQAEADGFVRMRQDGWEKVMQGLTTIEEVLSVTPES